MSVSKSKATGLNNPMLRKIARLHRQMDAAEAAGGVQPPPIVNRRTGEVRPFGPRRAFDGAWVIEMLGASGCTKEEVDGAIFVLEPLIEHGIKIDKDLLELLTIFYEPVPMDELRKMETDFKRSQFRIVDDEGEGARVTRSHMSNSKGSRSGGSCLSFGAYSMPLPYLLTISG